MILLMILGGSLPTEFRDLSVSVVTLGAPLNIIRAILVHSEQ